MNLKLPIKINSQQKKSILDYFENCGYPAVEHKSGDFSFWMSDAPGYGEITPVIEGYKDNQEGHNEEWFYIRLPEKS